MSKVSWNIDLVRQEYEKNNCKLKTLVYGGQYDQLTFDCYCRAECTKSFKSFLKLARCSNKKEHDRRMLAIQEGKDPNETQEIKTDRKKNTKKDLTTYENIVKYGNEIHGEGVIIYRHLHPNFKYKHDTKYFLECSYCQFIWITSNDNFINHQSGCGMCKNEGIHINLYTVDMMKFISDRIHNQDYTFLDKSMIDGEIQLFKKSDDTNVWCGKDNHDPFVERIGKFFSRSKNANDRTKGCPQCYEEKKATETPKEKVIWFQNYKALLELSAEIYGKDTYLYRRTKPEDLVNIESVLKIDCNIIKDDGKICGNEFEKSIRDHIRAKLGCPECSNKTKKITYEIFLDRMNQKYINGEFLYDLVDPENIKNNKSKPRVKCSVCNYVLENCTVCQLLANGYTKCSNCNSNARWDEQKLKLRIAEREKEGKYTYECINYAEILSKRSKAKITCIHCKQLGLEDPTFMQSLEDHFTSHHGCPRCNSYQDWSGERIRKACEEKAKEGKYDYSLVDFDKIRNQNSNMDIICTDCKRNDYEEYEFTTSVHCHFWMTTGCPRCSNNMPWTYERFIDEVSRLPSAYIQLYDLSKVTPEMFDKVGKEKIIPIGCRVCLLYSDRYVGDFMTLFRGCRHCSKSELARVTFQALRILGINFKTEEICKGFNGNNNYYDCVFSYNDQKYILEVDGKMHFEYIPRFHDEEEGKFEAARFRDVHKHWSALHKSRKVIRIDYTVPFSQVLDHIIKALQLLENGDSEYYSNPEMYDWLIEGVKNYVPPSSQ